MLIGDVQSSYGGMSVPDKKTSSGSSTEEMGYDDFLNLFVIQLKNQDPLNPLDSADFTAQLAQFASVEQLYGVNENLSDIQDTINSKEERDFIGLIGKTVKVDGNAIQIEDGAIIPGSYSLGDKGKVTVDIFDSNGQKVRTLQLGLQDQGEHTVKWDGKNDSGEAANYGSYTFEVSARDEAGHVVDSNTYISGELTGVTYKYGLPYLMIGDRLISTDQAIIEVSKSPIEGA